MLGLEEGCSCFSILTDGSTTSLTERLFFSISGRKAPEGQHQDHTEAPDKRVKAMKATTQLLGPRHSSSPRAKPAVLRRVTRSPLLMPALRSPGPGRPPAAALMAGPRCRPGLSGDAPPTASWLPSAQGVAIRSRPTAVVLLCAPRDCRAAPGPTPPHAQGTTHPRDLRGRAAARGTVGVVVRA